MVVFPSNIFAMIFPLIEPIQIGKCNIYLS